MATPRKPRAAKAEALSEAVDFEYDGDTYTVPPTSEWDLDVLEAAEDGKAVTFVRALLGPDQWATFKARPRKTTDLEKLAEAMAAAAGLGN